METKATASALIALLLAAGRASAGEAIRIDGFRGELSEMTLLVQGDPSLPESSSLTTAAEAALGYLARNPDPKHGYQCRFSFFLLNCPPFVPVAAPARGFIDPIMIGDTESRNDIAFNQMREMCGSGFGREAQEAVHKRLVGYLRSGEGRFGDDMSWIFLYAGSPDTDAEYAVPWTTGKLLQSESDLYRATGDESHRKLARRIFEGLRRFAKWDTGRAYYEKGCQGYREGKYARGYEGHYPAVIGPIASYWSNCGDPEALAFAKAMADGFLADLQPGHLHQPDGSVRGHNHCQMHAVRGVAELGARTGDVRYLEWAKAAYAYYDANALDTGWLPEICEDPDHCYHSETCLVADMTEIAAWLAMGGWPDYWDRVDRAVRNYFLPAQFRVTPQVEAFYREVNKRKPAAEVEVGLGMLKDLEGGFISALTPNDRVFEVRAGGNHFGAVALREHRLVFDMMGCCPPEGMRGIYFAWNNIVREAPEGVMVNLAFSRDARLAKVSSDMPRLGRLTVTAKVGSDFWLRPPGWAPRGQVKARRNQKDIAVTWGGPAQAYAGFRSVTPGEVLEISWPLVRFKQRIPEKWIAREPKPRTYVYSWTGSTVTAVEPAGEWLPLYGR